MLQLDTKLSDFDITMKYFNPYNYYKFIKSVFRIHLRPSERIRNTAIHFKKLFNGHNPDTTIIVAGLGRSGTTIVADELKKQYKVFSKDYFISRFQDYNCTNTIEKRKKKIRPGYLYKTHDFAPKILPSYVKVIFIYGNPINTTFSAKKNYKKKAMLKFGSDSSLFPKLFEQDIMNLYDILKSWIHHKHIPILAMKYEVMWNSENEIRNFTDFTEFKLPAYIRRTDYKTIYSDKLYEQVEKTHRKHFLLRESTDDVLYINVKNK